MLDTTFAPRVTNFELHLSRGPNAFTLGVWDGTKRTARHKATFVNMRAREAAVAQRFKWPDRSERALLIVNPFTIFKNA
jgi:putative SOS response-associated peptidase YedK